MSHSVLNKKSYEAPSMFGDLVGSAGVAWEAMTRSVVINGRSKSDGFRIPSPPPQKKAKAGAGVGHSYQKSGQMHKK